MERGNILVFKSSKFTLTILFFLSISLNLYAQTVTVTPPTPVTAPTTVTVPAQTPAAPGTTVPSPAAFPSYTVTPSEDLNPYGLSTLGNSTEDNYRDAPGTLGTNKKRTSNAEANKDRIERKKAENEEKSEIEENTSSSEVNSQIENQAGSTANYKKSKLIRWTDNNGNVHITNDIGNVPQKYMESVEYK